MLDYLSVGPSRSGLGAKIKMADGPSRIILAGHRAAARFMLAREMAGTRYDRQLKDLLFNLDEAATRPWPITGDEFLSLTAPAALEVRYDAAAEERLREHLRRTQARYSRWLPSPQEDGTVEWTHLPGTISADDMQHARETLNFLGWDRELFPFAYDGVVEMATKKDVLIASAMGTGKSRMALALAEYHRQSGPLTGPTIIIGQRRHLFPTWPDELAKLDLIQIMYGEHPYETLVDKKDKPTYQKPFLLVSFERLTRMIKDDPKEFAKLVAVAKTSTVIVDEIYVVAHIAAQKTQALLALSGARHIALSGSPIRGYASSALVPLSWTFRGGSCALPDYPLGREGNAQRFASMYTTVAVDSASGRRKRVPFLKNEDHFYDMISPLFYRRLRNEPEVIRDIGDLILEEETVEVKLDPDHIQFYLACLKRFTDWYIRELRKRGTPNAFPANELLVKLGYLIRGVTSPWRMSNPQHQDEIITEELDWPEYPRRPTAVHKAVIERVIEEVSEGYQVLIFSTGRDPVELMAEALNAEGVGAVHYHGGVSQQQRADYLLRFKAGEFPVICATYATMAEGLNLAVASRVHITDYDWSPSTIKQAVARITRPDQKYTPHATYWTVPGTIQDYVRQWCMLKQSAMDAALDGITQDDSGGNIPDIQFYAFTLANYEEDTSPSVPREFELELDEEE